MWYKTVLLFIATFSALSVSAQDITGNVSDAKTLSLIHI